MVVNMYVSVLNVTCGAMLSVSFNHYFSSI